MCGRYSLSTTAELVEEVFGVEAPDGLAPRWNIAPSEPAPVVRVVDGGRRLDLLPWGMVIERRASRDAGEQTPAGGRLRINARSESASTLRAFRDSFRARRCLVPSDGFYEWGSGPQGRVPYHIRFRDRRVFAFAGLWDGEARSGEGPRVGFAVLTCPPSELVRPLHDRMPVILPAESWDEWLRADDAAPLASLLVPWEGSDMEAVPVSTYVNRAGNEGPECLSPPPPPRPPAQRSLFP